MNRWDEFYIADTRILSAPPTQLSLRAARVFSEGGNHRILDLGCGAGRDLDPLQEAGLDVVGLDAAAAGLALARSHGWEGKAPDLVRGDARQLPFADSSFDGVYSFGLLHEFTEDAGAQDIERCMAEIRRVLRNSGCLVLAVLAGNPREGLPHVRLFSEEMLASATRGLFRVSLDLYSDIGCTGSHNYRIWAGIYRKGQ